jgi:hypothetical protein
LGLKTVIIRILFGLALIWMLVPREPDIGFGRPGLPKHEFVTDIARSLKPFVGAVVYRVERAARAAPVQANYPICVPGEHPRTRSHR